MHDLIQKGSHAVTFWVISRIFQTMKSFFLDFWELPDFWEPDKTSEIHLVNWVTLFAELLLNFIFSLTVNDNSVSKTTFSVRLKFTCMSEIHNLYLVI